METQTIDQEFERLQSEFHDVAVTVQALAEKMQEAEKAGDSNATEWLADLKQVAKDIDDEQTQAKVLLLAVHSFITGIAQGQSEPAEAASPSDHPPLFAPGHEPQEDDSGAQGYSQQQQQHHGIFGGMLGGGMLGGGMLGGGMLGGGMLGGYSGGGFGRAMEMEIGRAHV